MSVEQRIAEMYNDYEVKPYISPERDLATWLLEAKPVPKRNMVRLEEGLLPGDIILLWRINFGTFETTTPYSKYFEYIYGINGPEHMEQLRQWFLSYFFSSLEHKHLVCSLIHLSLVELSSTLSLLFLALD